MKCVLFGNLKEIPLSQFDTIRPLNFVKKKKMSIAKESELQTNSLCSYFFSPSKGKLYGNNSHASVTNSMSSDYNTEL